MLCFTESKNLPMQKSTCLFQTKNIQGKGTVPKMHNQKQLTLGTLVLMHWHKSGGRNFGAWREGPNNLAHWR